MAVKRYLTVEALEALGRKAVEAGNRCDLWQDRDALRRLIRWDVSGGCTSAVFIELHARYSATHGKRVKPMTVLLETRCRRCGWCLDQRRKFWALRAQQEYAMSARTWFCTLTVGPDQQFGALNRVRAACDKQGVDFDSLPEAERFTMRVVELGLELTKFIKRIRKNSGAPLRYLVVAEKHKSGAPHFHMLVHETSATPIRKRIIKDAWTIGFSQVELCHDSRGAVYLCKYLAKQACTRVRASFRYGLQADLNASAIGSYFGTVYKHDPTTERGEHF